MLEEASDEICSFASIECYRQMPSERRSIPHSDDIEENAHLASGLSTFYLLLECSIDCLRLLADNLGLIDENNYTRGER